MLLSSTTHRICYDLIGPETGDTVCFAHALLADSGMWADQATALVKSGLRALRIDMRGHGGSDVPTGPCSAVDLARDALTVFDHLSLKRVHFVGLSIGGVIGQALATHFPERLISLVLSDTNAISAPNAKAMWAERVALVRQAGSAAPLAPAMMPRLLSNAFEAHHTIRWRQIRATIEATRPEGVLVGAEALQNFDFMDALPSFAMPTLVLCGANDPATPPSEAKKIAARIPKSQYHEIEDSLHFPNVERPDVYSDILLKWFFAKS